MWDTRPSPSNVALMSLRDLNRRSPLKFVHSSFHGVGHNYVQEAFQTFGFSPPIPVPEQKDPDPNFSSVSCPNPEEGQSVLVGHRSQLDKQDVNLVSWHGLNDTSSYFCPPGTFSSSGGEGKSFSCPGNGSGCRPSGCSREV